MHILQSKHIKLKADDASKLLAKYSIINTQLPKIKNSDPALEGLNIKKGDIVKILRKDEEGKEMEYYRIVD